MPEPRAARPAEPARKTTQRSDATGGGNEGNGGDAGQQEVRDRLAEIQEQGYEGYVVDETPNEAYALPNAGEGTPEADRVHPDKQKK